ncbi:MAG: CocE/NonD family hydrolase [Chloroflexi bacterium]|nr:CocE/NonD family hydrolase [Chloroflexota bacterium]
MADGPRRERQGSWQQYDWVRESNVMIPLRDGVRLATDIYRPALNGRPIEGKFPTLLERTPYDKQRPNIVADAKFFARHGYVVAAQDVRGRHASEGVWYAFAREGPDGYDSVEWLAHQPWSDGKIGTIGLSYSGSDQSALGSLNPPHLAAQFVSEGMSSYYHLSLRHMGAMELRFLVYAFFMARNSKEVQDNPPLRHLLEDAFKNAAQYLTRLPFRKGTTPLQHVPAYEEWIYDLITRADFDEYWLQPGFNLEAYYGDHADVPIYHLGSWYDSYARSTTQNYVAMSERKQSPMKLIMGSYVHGAASLALSYAGDVDTGIDAPLDYNALRLRWFDQTLKGLATGILDEPPITIFVMGGGDGRKNAEGRLNHGGYWRTETAWPLERAQDTTFYLHADGSLTTEPPVDAPPSQYRFDPNDPVPTMGGCISAAPEVLPGGGFDQRGRPGLPAHRDTLPFSMRRDVLVFQTELLTEDVEVTGPITVKLWVSTSAVDTDFTAKLIDVYPSSEDYPDGYDLNISDSILRLRYRDSFSEPTLLIPGEVYAITIVPYPTSNVFKAGHRIRVDISSSNFPRFDVNPNTGEPLGKHRRVLVAEQSVYHDPERPSHIVLPIVPIAQSPSGTA